MSEELGVKGEILDFLDLLKGLAADLGCVEEVNASSRLHEKLKNDDWYLTLVGETSSGKSTMANSFMDDDLLPVTSSSTTGVVTLIKANEESAEDEFYPVDSQGQIGSEISRSEFRKQAKGTGTTKRLLVKKRSIPNLPRGVTMVDTPGFNSCVKEHVSVLNEYLPESDAVIFFINYRLGLREVDLEYFRLVTQILQEDLERNESVSGLFPAINFAPSPHEDKRVVEIRKRLGERLGYSGPIEILISKRVNGRMVLQNEDLLARITAIVENPDRAGRLMSNALTLSEALLSRIGEEIRLKQQVFLSDEENLTIIAARLNELRDLQESMIQRVRLADKQLSAAIVEASDRQNFRIKQTIDNELSESSRWTSIESASTYIAETLVECSINDAAHELSDLIRQEIERLNRDLDDLAANLDEKIRNFLELPLDKLSGGVDERFLGKLAELLGGRGLGYYLGGLGGAIGDKGVVGVMNLARKLMGYANRLWGSTIFGREAMARVPAVLKQFGLTTSRVAGAAAAVALEIAVYLYKAATWKNKLRDKLAPVIDEHVEHLKVEALKAKKDIIKSTSQMVADNYSRRIEVLSEALSERKQGRSVDPETMTSWTRRWSDLVDRLDRLGERVRGV
jgi:hypothetical protein